MAFIGDGGVSGRIELSDMLRKRRYPRGKIAIANLEKHFKNRLETMYKNAPKKWKTEYTKAVFGGIRKYKKLVSQK